MISLGEIYGALRRNSDYFLTDIEEVLELVTLGRTHQPIGQAQGASVNENFDKCGKWVAVDSASTRAEEFCTLGVAYAGGRLIVDRRVKQRRAVDNCTRVILHLILCGMVALPDYGRRKATLDRRLHAGVAHFVRRDLPDRRGQNAGRRLRPRKEVYGGRRSSATRRAKDFQGFFQPDPKDRRTNIGRTYTTSPDHRIIVLERRKK